MSATATKSDRAGINAEEEGPFGWMTMRSIDSKGGAKPFRAPDGQIGNEPDIST